MDPPNAQPPITFGPFRYDPDSRLLYRNDQEIALPLRVAAVLESLLERPGEIVAKDAVLASAWEGAFVGEDSLTQAISQLRQALGDDPHHPTYIQTIPKRGYRFVAEVTGVAEDVFSAAVSDPAEEPASAHRPSPSARGARNADLLRWVLAAATLLTVALAWFLFTRPAETSGPSSIHVLPPPGVELAGRWFDSVAISADGERLAYVGRDREGVKHIYVSTIDRPDEAREIPGTGGAIEPFFSPDGAWLGFFQDRSLMKVSLGGGDPVTIYEGVDASYPTGADWGPDDTILFSPSYSSGIWGISASGENLKVLTTPDCSLGEIEHDWPLFLPGGREALFTNYKGNMNRAEIVRISLETGERHVVYHGGYGIGYATSGHLIFGQGYSLFAVRYDIESGETDGMPVTIPLQVRSEGHEGRTLMAFSDTGVLFYLTGGPAPSDNTLVLVDRAGGVVRRYPQPPRSLYRLSSDGRKLLTFSVAEDKDVWVIDLTRDSDPERLTFDPHWDGYPVVSRDGQVAFASERDCGAWNIFVVPLDGSEDVTPLIVNDHQSIPGSWSPDGKLLAYQQDHPDTGEDIWIVDIDNPGNPKAFLTSKYDEAYPAFSPDGRWLAFASNEAGENHFEFYVVPFPEGRPRYKVSTGAVRYQSLRWAADGREIFYLPPIPGKEFFAVSIDTEPEFRVGETKVLFWTEDMSPERVNANLYDVHPDGEHFIMRTQEEPQPFRLHVQFGWFTQLEQLATTRGDE